LRDEMVVEAGKEGRRSEGGCWRQQGRKQGGRKRQRGIEMDEWRRTYMEMEQGRKRESLE
jgi:hypothetical protein